LPGLSAEQITKVLLIERLFGQTFHLTMLSGQAQGQGQDTTTPSASEQQTAAAQAQPQGNVVQLRTHQTVDDAEQTDFAAQGSVTTDSGQQINFQLGLMMSRAFHSSQDSVVQVGDAARRDPLVVNDSGAAAQFTGSSVSLPSGDGGAASAVPTLDAHSGYLVYDPTGASTLSSTNQLVGASTGNGFTELAQYDKDKNGWIDENDQVYSQLRVWKPSAQGSGVMETLKQAGVGAIYLGAESTPFQLKNSKDTTVGDVAETSVYLNDNGTAGTIQEVNYLA